MSAPEAGTVELRPDLTEYRALLKSRLPIAIPLLVLLVVRVLRSPWSSLIVVVALVLLALVGLTHVRTARIVLTSTAVEHHGLIVRHRVIRFDDARAVLGAMTQPLSSETPTLAVQSRSTGQSMRIFGGLWNPEQLGTIADRVGAVRLTEPVDGTTMDTYVPGAIPLRYRRPFIFALAIGVVMIPGAVALAIAST